MTCKVSVIMPSYNVANYIDKCIQSVLDQTLQDIEILCIDAGSTDGTLEKINKYATKSSRINVVNSDVKSYGYQVNLGFKMAAGDYIGIVETDDYIKPDMYEKLYHYAEKYNPDYIKGSYEMVCSSKTLPIYGMGTFDEFEQAIDPRNIDSLYVYDLHIWRGIYKKQFLIENNILLNESSGAAFQDIGFSQKVLSCAKSAVYVDEPLYCYRTDRDESSTYSPKCFKNTYVEFESIVDGDFSSKIVNESGIYKRMAMSFLWEIDAILKLTGYNYKNGYIIPYYGWFTDKLTYAFEKKLLDGDEISEGDIKKIRLAVDSIDKYAESAKIKNEQIQQDRIELEAFQRIILENPIVIFGCGIRGKRVLEYAKLNNINILSLTDNNSDLWGNTIDGIHILPPKKCLELYSHAVWVIANAKYEDEIIEQIIGLGINENRIIKSKI